MKRRRNNLALKKHAKSRRGNSVEDFSLQTKLNRFLDNEYQQMNAGYYSEGIHLSGDITLTSSDPYFCLRKIEIARRFKNEIKAWVPPAGLQRIFDNGTDVHRRYQRYFTLLGDGKTCGLFGRWKCTKCAKKFYAFAPQKCKKCSAPKKYLSYREYPYRHKRYEILSTCDGLWWEKINGTWYEFLLEFKSIKSASNYYGDVGFNELVGPIDKHYEQANGYGNLRRLELKKGKSKGRLPDFMKKWPIQAGIIVWYENKDNQQIKDYYVPITLKPWKEIVRRIKAIFKHERRNIFAPRICETKADAKEHRCDLAKICFRIKD